MRFNLKSTRCKCDFTNALLDNVYDFLQESCSRIMQKPVTELSETDIYRLFALQALSKRFYNRIDSAPMVKLSFNLSEVITLKNCLMPYQDAPGVAAIFMQLEKKVHPGIQLEI